MNNQRSLLFLLLASFMFIFSCTDKSGSDQSTDDDITQEEREEAAVITATTNSHCTSINPFYWEIGDAHEVLVSGSTGDNSVTGTTVLPVASATKWLFGAYVVERLNGNLDTTTIRHLTMSSGYTSFGSLSCVPNYVTTVLICSNVGSNNVYTPANLNKFYYGGGHFQEWAVDNSMGSLTEAQLVTEFQTQLGNDVSFTFTSPQLAGGVTTSAEQYSIFLRKILSGDLLIKDHLGANAVCTNPATCVTAVSSPFTSENFHYSYGHWIEDDPALGDGSFSSAGMFGFYPWIDSSKTYYGIISRYEVPAGGNEIGSGAASQKCGALIRKAYLTGSSQ